MRTLRGFVVAALLPGCGSSTTPPAAPRLDTCRGPTESAWVADPRLCLVRYADGLVRPRGLAIAPNGDLFVVAGGRVTVLFDADGDGVSGPREREDFAADAPELNHGIAFDPGGRYLYASSATTVFRWPYRRGDRVARAPAERVLTGLSPVVPGMPRAGGHATRTLLFDPEGRLYVSVGSAHNVDVAPADLQLRSMVRRFEIPGSLRAGGLAYEAGRVVASGLRNAVGITFDTRGRFWAADQGRDELVDARFGGDIHEENPPEEIARLDGPGSTFHGYPDCWTEARVPANGGGAGTQHRDPDVGPLATHDEAGCQDPGRVRPPAGLMPAHWAPLGLVEYTGDLYPAAWRGSLFVTAHGSWNRTAAVGRLVARIPIGADGRPGEATPVVGERGPDGQLFQYVSTGRQWNVRPVDLRQGPDGALYVSDDEGGSIHRIGYR